MTSLEKKAVVDMAILLHLISTHFLVMVMAIEMMDFSTSISMTYLMMKCLQMIPLVLTLVITIVMVSTRYKDSTLIHKLKCYM